MDLEKRYLRKDRSFLWVRMTTALVREGDAKPEYSVEFLRDISGRKESRRSSSGCTSIMLDASRLAGMAEVATNVLHNVGNVLNSVNVSASLVTECVKHQGGRGVGLQRCSRSKARRVGEFIATDERGSAFRRTWRSSASN